ncbi:hypothetical protein B0T22DRAFT_140161 [Podospora appendiculata]|uniref:Rhodopsin domain-containing protein n=1 Tax=Podospora appendiculata TaxID=314037 RepID=A0AAE0X881_9PEZI|nr:hypothetical protein B0T22DRAFT_140161 [Podospora appendiculata]
MDANSTEGPSVDSPDLHVGAASPGLYPGQSPPFAVITATDQGGIILIATALALVFSVISMLIRLFIRFEFRHDFARDDIAAGVALVLGGIQSGLVFGQVSDGFGKTIDDVSAGGLLALQKSSYASDILYLLVLWLTKSSIAFLFIRLSPYRGHIFCANICLCMSTVFMIVSVLIISLRCDLHAPWIFIGAQCPGLLARWQAVAVFDVSTEVFLFAVSIYMAQALKLPFSKKAVVVLAFALRLPVIFPAIIRLIFLGTQLSSADPTLTGVAASVCTQIQLSYAIIAATTPCLRPFMTALSTHYGGPREPRTPKGSKAGNSGNSFSLASLSVRSRNAAAAAAASAAGRTSEDAIGTISAGDVLVTRWDQADYHVAIQSRAKVSADAGSLQSEESQRMIISKNTEWQVEYADEHSLAGGPAQPPSQHSHHS